MTVATNSERQSEPQKRTSDAFWRIIASFVIGFGLPVLACYGFMLVSALAFNLLIAGSASSTELATDVGIGEAVALIRVEGAIVSSAGPFDTNLATAAGVVGQIERAAEDDSVKAIVLVVNSPGGGVNASDLIHHALISQDKPIVVIMGDVAASGGYYISAPADWIIANPNTITGSIGVINGAFISIEGFLEEHGIEAVVITSGELKDTGSPFRDMTDEEIAYLQGMVDEVYESFVQIVAEGRDMPENEVRELADGRIFTGRQALENGLVDELGYQEDAIAKAAELGGIEGDPRIIEYQEELTFEDLFFGFAARRTFPTREEILNLIGYPTLEARWMGP